EAEVVARAIAQADILALEQELEAELAEELAKLPRTGPTSQSGSATSGQPSPVPLPTGPGAPRPSCTGSPSPGQDTAGRGSGCGTRGGNGLADGRVGYGPMQPARLGGRTGQRATGAAACIVRVRPSGPRSPATPFGFNNQTMDRSHLLAYILFGSD